MKRTLIAATAILSTGAFAQSSVSLYGIMDTYVGHLKNGLSTSSNGVPNPTAGGKAVVNAGGLDTSRWGLRGSEDLGGGLKTNFQIEQGFNSDDATGTGANGVQFDRQSWIGVSGGFGEIKLGRTYTPYHVFRGTVNNTANLNLNVTNDVFKAAGGEYTSSKANQLMYSTPVISGFSASVSYSLGEDKTATTSSNDTTSLFVRYASGPLNVGLTYQAEEASGKTDTRYTLVGGSYDFGAVKVTGAYNRVRRPVTNFGTTEESEYSLGASTVFGATTIYLGYADGKARNAAGTTTEKASGFDVVGMHSLSKRTTVYLGYKAAKEESGTDIKVGELRQVSLGIRHFF